MLSSIRRRVSVLACAIATIVLGVEFSLSEKSASATDDTLLSCVGTVTTQYSPGLTLLERLTTVTATGSFSPCVSVGNTINSGVYQGSAPGTYSCILNSNTPFTATVNWNDNKFSTVRYDAIVNQRGLAVTVTTLSGIVLSGEYSGGRVVLTTTTATLSALDCLSPQGVTSQTGVQTITILNPSDPL